MYRFGDLISSKIGGFGEEKAFENYVNNEVSSMSAVFDPNGDGDTFWYPPGLCLGSILDAFRRPWTQLWDHGVLWGRFWRSLKQVWELMVFH